MTFVALLLAIQDLGPHLPVKAEDAAKLEGFAKGQRIVATYYTFWWDAESGARLKNGDGTDALTHHPPKLSDVSYKRAAWHRKEFADMAGCGVDVALPRFRSEDWAREGVRAMVEALEAMEAEKAKAPKLAVFVDGLEGADLASKAGRDRFVAVVRDFYSRIPPRFWALVEGRPLVWVGPGAPKAVDAVLFETVREQMKADVAGREAWVVAPGWPGADAGYTWGAARAGVGENDVVAVGPGYDDRAVEGRKTPVREREKGVFYQRAWYAATRLKPAIVVIETWNNFHEGSEICESREFGRTYLDKTTGFIDRFKKGELVLNPEGPWSRAVKAVWNPKYNPTEQGLAPVATEDGSFDLLELAGITMLSAKAAQGDDRHLYFAVDDSWKYFQKQAYSVTVEFLDKGRGTFTLEYDSADASKKGAERWHKASSEEAFTDTGEWKTATFQLADAMFANRQAGGADFRLTVKKRGLAVRRVVVTPH